MALGVLKSLELEGVGPADHLTIEFGDRLNILTGDNGLGKSFILDVACWALTQVWPNQPALPRNLSDQSSISISLLNGKISDNSEITRHQFNFDYSNQIWKNGTIFLPNSNNLVIYAKIDGSFIVWQPRGLHTLWGLTPYSNGRTDSIKGISLTRDIVWNGDRNSNLPICNGLINDLSKWHYRDDRAIKIFQQVLDQLSPPDEPLSLGEPRRIRVEDARDIPTLNMPYGEVPVTVASSGIQRVLALAYVLVWSWLEHLVNAAVMKQDTARHLVFLMDEVEAHLHPKWQRGVVPALSTIQRRLEKELSIQLFITTHSPLVLASLEEIFDRNRDRLFNLDLEDGKVVLHDLPLQRRGDASSWLTSEVFGLRQPTSLAAERAIEEAMALMRKPNASITEIQEIHDKLRDVLSDTDPFWARWLVRAKAAGMAV